MSKKIIVLGTLRDSLNVVSRYPVFARIAKVVDVADANIAKIDFLVILEGTEGDLPQDIKDLFMQEKGVDRYIVGESLSKIATQISEFSSKGIAEPGNVFDRIDNYDVLFSSSPVRVSMVSASIQIIGAFILMIQVAMEDTTDEGGKNRLLAISELLGVAVSPIQAMLKQPHGNQSRGQFITAYLESSKDKLIRASDLIATLMTIDGSNSSNVTKAIQTCMNISIIHDRNFTGTSLNSQAAKTKINFFFNVPLVAIDQRFIPALKFVALGSLEQATIRESEVIWQSLRTKVAVFNVLNNESDLYSNFKTVMIAPQEDFISVYRIHDLPILTPAFTGLLSGNRKLRVSAGTFQEEYSFVISGKKRLIPIMSDMKGHVLLIEPRDDIDLWEYDEEEGSSIEDRIEDGSHSFMSIEAVFCIRIIQAVISATERGTGVSRSQYGIVDLPLTLIDVLERIYTNRLKFAGLNPNNVTFTRVQTFNIVVIMIVILTLRHNAFAIPKLKQDTIVQIQRLTPRNVSFVNVLNYILKIVDHIEIDKLRELVRATLGKDSVGLE